MRILNSHEECLRWISNRLEIGRYFVERIPLTEVEKWSYDINKTNYSHDSGKFFSVRGLDIRTNLGRFSHWQQPIIDQPEQGILGFARYQVDDEYHYLIQAKIEPGNPGLIQVSPTLQATRSNLTRVHAGKSPKYVSYFMDSDSEQVDKVVKLPLSETASRFLEKSNYNMVVDLKKQNCPTNDEFAWLSEKAIKKLLFVDNAVNMDARSILSLVLGKDIQTGDAHGLTSWLSTLRQKYPTSRNIIPLSQINGWKVREDEICCTERNEFKLIGIRTNAPEREVPQWTQPILRHEGVGICGLIVNSVGSEDYYLVQGKPEAGSHNGIELAPTVSFFDFDGRKEERSHTPFAELFEDRDLLEFSVLHSEEGGRFDHFINEYCLLRYEERILNLPENYRWATFGELKAANRIMGVVSSELRTLITLLGARQ